MKTRIKYYWLCTYTAVAGGEKTVIIGHAKTNKPLLFDSPGSAAIFLKKAGFADYMQIGKCKCELKELKV